MLGFCWQTLRKKRVFWAAALLIFYWLACFTLTHMPLPSRSGSLSQFPHLDKVVHFVMFFGLTFLLTWFLLESGNGYRKSILTALFIAITYGALDEISQGWVHRTTDVYDWMADTTGACAGIVFVFATRPYLQAKLIKQLTFVRGRL